MVHPVFTTAEWDRLLSQVGYGNPEAPLWFLGMEEGLDEHTLPISENLKWRLNHFKQPFDTMTNHLQALFMPYAAGVLILPKTQTWPTMAKIARYLAGAANWQDPSKAKAYVKECLGTARGSALLLELLPLPKPCFTCWPPLYNERFTGGLAAYIAEMLPLRVARLKRLAEDHKPTRIICYGKGYWQYYEQIFPEVAWTEHVVGAKTKVKKGMSGGTIVMLTPFFGNGALSNAALIGLCAQL
ncbi:MAG TPA: hypothetical protein VNL71_14805 [Chloroflexota bacterium]|nr:hypothetical protein [Chloroflexota bacterium]